jgi:hypothetical protein
LNHMACIRTVLETEIGWKLVAKPLDRVLGMLYNNPCQ